MTNAAETLPADLASAHAMILAERAARLSAESDRRVLDIEIERLKLEIARLKRERYGQSAERGARIEQLELSLEDLEETAAAIEAAAVSDAAPSQSRRKPARRPLPDHLPRLRVVETTGVPADRAKNSRSAAVPTDHQPLLLRSSPDGYVGVNSPTGSASILVADIVRTTCCPLLSSKLAKRHCASSTRGTETMISQNSAPRRQPAAHQRTRHPLLPS